MKIERILSNRWWRREYYWKIVYEWEDCLSTKLSIPISHNILANLRLAGLWRMIVGSTANIPVTKKVSLAFVMYPFAIDDNIAGKPNIIPVIIDFWKRDDSYLNEFENRYRDNPAVLITSRQVYDFLIDKGIRLKLFHWPLSLPDKYCFSSNDKKYDCILVGRPSVMLRDWMIRYSERHEDFTYIYNDRDNKRGMLRYVTSTGRFIGNGFSSRAAYFELLKASRVGLYSTPSVDNDKLLFNELNSNGFDQVTPRLFEYIASGCHVLARYTSNSDTEYFDLKSIVPHIETYEEFESRMDYARTHLVNEKMYIDWLSRHYTSTRATMLEKIMQSI